MQFERNKLTESRMSSSFTGLKDLPARLLTILMLAALLTAPAMAQTVSGTVNGLVTDASGAIIPNAAITIKNTETGETRHVTSNSDGLYSVPALPPGKYEVDAVMPGFQSQESKINLSIGQTVKADFRLSVGSDTQKVEVTTASETVNLQTESHDLNGLLQADDLENSPQYTGSRGETFYIQSLMVGVQPISGQGANGSNSNVTQFNEQSNGLLIGGQNVFSTLYLQDGVTDMNYFAQTATVQPPVEATQETEVIRSTANARYDGASVVNVVSKSGTDKIHGRLYEQLENNIFNARTYNGGTLSENRYNQFGGNVGWYVPMTHKRLFFFVDYQGYRNINAAFLQDLLPTQAERNGDFSADLVANAGTKQAATVIYDPTSAVCTASGCTLQPFMYNGQKNVIDPARISKYATNYLNQIYPLPNFMNTTAGNNYGSTHSRTQFTHDSYLYRGDYNISDSDRLYGAYDTTNPNIIRPEFVDDCLCYEPNPLFGTDIYVEESHMFRNGVANTARVGYSRSITGKNFGHVGNGHNYFQEFGLTGLNPDPNAWSWPATNPSGFSGPSGQPQDAWQNMFEYSDEVNWIRGRHTMYAGMEYDRIMYKGVWVSGNPNGALTANGEYTYNGSSAAAWQRPGIWTLGSVTMPYANYLADWLLGYYSATNASAGTQVGWFRQFNAMPYFQDDWHATKKLTLNLGFRYDFYSPPTETKNHAGTYDITTNKYRLGSFDASYKNFSPRVGFAYAMDDKTSIHAGFGVYYFKFAYFDLIGMENDPFYITQLNSTQTQTQPVIWPASNAAGNPDIPGSVPGQQEYFTLANAEALWAAMPTPSGVFGTNGTTFAPKMPTSYSQQWNLAIQRAFGTSWLLTVDYLGTVDKHLLLYHNPNLASLPGPSNTNPSSTADINSRRPYTTYASSLTQYDKGGASNYNAFEAQLEKRFSHGFSLRTSILWGKSMDFQDSDRAFGMFGNHPQTDWARSDFSQRYVYKANGVYELPFGRSKMFLNHGKWWENELGGWRVSGIFTVNGPFPISITATDASNTGGGITMRAQQTCNGNTNAPHTFAKFFNTSCYANPATNTFGNSARNSVFGPRDTNLDLSIFKEFPIYDRLKFQWRTDAFSALNHPLPQNPQGSVTSSTFGQVTGWGGARILQFGAKILF